MYCKHEHLAQNELRRHVVIYDMEVVPENKIDLDFKK